MADTSQEKPEVTLVGLGDYVHEMLGPHITTNLIRVNSALERLRKKRSQADDAVLVAMYDALINCQVEHGEQLSRRSRI